MEDNNSKKIPLIYSIVYGLQKESYNPNYVGNQQNNFPLPDYNYQNSNISPQNNYMFTSDQRMGNFPNNANQIKSNKNNNLGK